MHGLTWIAISPKMKLIPNKNKRKPYPLSWEEQAALFRELPSPLAEMALFSVNTGCRDQEVCNLRWEWEVRVPELGTSVFIIPGTQVKNEDDRLVVLNTVAASIIEARRGKDRTYVFATDNHGRMSRMMTSSWKSA